MAASDPKEILPLSNTSEPTEDRTKKPSNIRKLLAAQIVLLIVLFIAVQVYYSSAGAEILPGAMDTALQQDENQDFITKLVEQKIFAIHTADTQYACCLIPKNGCTYHIGLLHRIMGVEDYENLGVVHNASAKSDMDITRFANDEIESWLSDPSVPKYILLRNPITRTLSAYIDKIERYLDDDEKTAKSFEDWLDAEFPVGSRNRTDVLRWNPHWRPQSHFCGLRMPDISKAFKLFRFEDPEKVVEYIYEFVPHKFLDDGWGKTANVSLREFMLGPRKRSGGTEDKFLTYFPTLRVFDRLATELEEDIDILGYREEVDQLRETVAKAEADRSQVDR